MFTFILIVVLTMVGFGLSVWKADSHYHYFTTPTEVFYWVLAVLILIIGIAATPAYFPPSRSAFTEQCHSHVIHKPHNVTITVEACKK